MTAHYLDGDYKQQRTEYYLIPLPQFSKGYGYWCTESGLDVLEWCGEAKQWTFIESGDCEFIPQPAHTEMLDNRPLLYRPCELWEGFLAVQQQDYQKDFTDPETGAEYTAFPWWCLIDGYPREE